MSRRPLTPGFRPVSYTHLDSKKTISREDFITRNKNIYEGIEARDLKLEIMSVEKIDSNQRQAYYNLRMETVAGALGNPGNVRLRKDSFFGEYRLVWNSAVILPGLSETAKVSVTTTCLLYTSTPVKSILKKLKNGRTSSPTSRGVTGLPSGTVTPTLKPL